MEQDWSHSQEMPSGDKSQHSQPFFHLDLLWITGLSSRHQDVHCRKGGWIPYLKSKGESEPKHFCRRVETAHVALCLLWRHWHTFAQSRRSVCQIQKDDFVAKKYEKCAFHTHVWLLTNTDCKLGSRIVYKSRLQLTKSFPYSEVKKIELRQNNMLYKNVQEQRWWMRYNKSSSITIPYRVEQFFTKHSKPSAVNPNFRLSVTVCSCWEKKTLLFTSQKIWWTLLPSCIIQHKTKLKSGMEAKNHRTDTIWGYTLPIHC